MLSTAFTIIQDKVAQAPVVMILRCQYILEEFQLIQKEHIGYLMTLPEEAQFQMICYMI